MTWQIACMHYVGYFLIWAVTLAEIVHLVSKDLWTFAEILGDFCSVPRKKISLHTTRRGHSRSHSHPIPYAIPSSNSVITQAYSLPAQPCTLGVPPKYGRRRAVITISI